MPLPNLSNVLISSLSLKPIPSHPIAPAQRSHRHAGHAMAFVLPQPVPLPSAPPLPRALCPRRIRPSPPARRAPRRLRRAPRMDVPGAGIYSPSVAPSSVRVVIFGATGYIGRYVVLEFLRQGFSVVAFARPRSGVKRTKTEADVRADFDGARVVFGDVTDPSDVARAFASEEAYASTVVVSCLASRTGGISDSNLIDFEATLNTLEVGRNAGAGHFILLSAICVEKPLLEFQRAKLRFEAALQDAAKEDEAFSYSIVRPTAFFKSLAGQVERMKKGAAFVMFEDGELCKCNALSERDLARFMALCAREEGKRNKILPVGGPGEAVTPKEQAEMLFRILGKKPKYVSLPIGLMDAAIGALDFVAKWLPFMKDGAEFGKIGKYYAVEDMIGPQFGEDTLQQFFENASKDGGMLGQDLGSAQIF